MAKVEYDFRLHDGVLYAMNLKALQYLNFFYFPPELCCGVGAVKANPRLIQSIKDTKLTITEDDV